MGGRNDGLVRPGRADAPSYYQITPPEPTWPQETQDEWLTMFSRTTLPTITVHEVAPGHYAHWARTASGPRRHRRTLMGDAFAEGWAHYVEEVAIERDSARTIPGSLSASRWTRCAASSGWPARSACTPARWTSRRRLDGSSRTRSCPRRRASEARRGTFDPRYGMYTQGKWAILDLRERREGSVGSRLLTPPLPRRHVVPGQPPIGLLDEADSRRLSRLRAAHGSSVLRLAGDVGQRGAPRRLGLVQRDPVLEHPRRDATDDRRTSGTSAVTTALARDDHALPDAHAAQHGRTSCRASSPARCVPATSRCPGP